MAGYNSSFLCRICLADGATLPIFGDAENDIHSKLCLCLNETIEDKYGYPKNVCDLCQSTLNIVYNFIKKFHQSCQVLEESFGTVIKVEQIKIEVNEEQNLATTDCDDVQDITKLETSIGDSKNEMLKDKYNNNKSFASSDEGDFIWNEEVQCTNSSIISHKGKKRKRIIMKNDLQENLVMKPTRKVGIQKRVSQSGSDNITIRKKVICKKGQPSKLKKPIKTNMLIVPPAQNADQPPEPVQRLCDICGIVFNHPDKLKWHRDVVHFKTGATTCEICHKVLSTSHGLKRHMSRAHLIVTERTFGCDKCSKTFLTEEYLKHHIRIHSNNKPKNKGYFCKFCNKKFANTMAQLIHERSVHTGERPAVCSVCDKSFFHEMYLKEHMRLHTGERPFKCPICERGYAQRGNMKSHLRNHKISDLDPELLSKLKPSYLKHLKP